MFFRVLSLETSLRDPSHKWAPPSYNAEGGMVSKESTLKKREISNHGK